MRKCASAIIAACIACISFPVFAGEEAGDRQEPEKVISEGSPFSQVKFNPDIALIADMSAVYRSLDDDTYLKTRLKGYQAFSGNEEEANQLAANANIGFNLNYAELALSATVDPYFELMGIFHVSPEGFDIEEAYLKTTSLPGGFGIKAGKFLSGFGKLNGQHAHQWDFTDMPLPYASFFGEEGLNDPGVQVVWVAPAGFFMQVGAEAFKGTNEASFGNKKWHDALFLQRVAGSKGPNLYAAFMKTSFDIKDLTVLVGASGAMGTARRYNDLADIGIGNMNVELMSMLGEGVRARTWVAGAELLMKYFIDSKRYVSLQGEYLYRVQRGGYYYTAMFHTALVPGYQDIPLTPRVSYYSRQWGMYSQLIVKPFLRFRIGGRFDMIGTHRLSVAGHHKGNVPSILYRASGMADFYPSEFSLFRLQYNHDRTRFNQYNHLKINHEVVLQANIAIGAHGAHAF